MLPLDVCSHSVISSLQRFTLIFIARKMNKNRFSSRISLTMSSRYSIKSTLAEEMRNYREQKRELEPTFIY